MPLVSRKVPRCVTCFQDFRQAIYPEALEMGKLMEEPGSGSKGRVHRIIHLAVQYNYQPWMWIETKCYLVSCIGSQESAFRLSKNHGGKNWKTPVWHVGGPNVAACPPQFSRYFRDRKVLKSRSIRPFAAGNPSRKFMFVVAFRGVHWNDAKIHVNS